jgi:hypothetical protein
MRISELVDKLNEIRMRHGDIQVLSCPPVNMACLIGSDECWTDELNVDCDEETKDSRGKQAVKVYGYDADPDMEIAAGDKCFPGYTVEETNALIEGERQMAELHLQMLRTKDD